MRSELETESGGEEIDIDLDDPDVGKAALNIQAGYCGMKARQSVREIKQAGDTLTEFSPVMHEEEEDTKKEATNENLVPSESEKIDIDLDNPEVTDATIKIQAGFRGSQARKNVKSMREDQLAQEKTGKETAKESSSNGSDSSSSSESSASSSADNEEVDKEENELDIDLNDPEVVNATTKIQAGFRGHQTRKEMRQNVVVDDNQESNANIASNKVLQKIGLQFVNEFMYENEPINWYELKREDYGTKMS